MASSLIFLWIGGILFFPETLLLATASTTSQPRIPVTTRKNWGILSKFCVDNRICEDITHTVCKKPANIPLGSCACTEGFTSIQGAVTCLPVQIGSPFYDNDKCIAECPSYVSGGMCVDHPKYLNHWMCQCKDGERQGPDANTCVSSITLPVTTGSKSSCVPACGLNQNCRNNACVCNNGGVDPYCNKTGAAGDGCWNSDFCKKSNSFCDVKTKVCTCPKGLLFVRGRCQKRQHGDSCQHDRECRQGFGNSVCLSGLCRCPANHYLEKNKSCKQATLSTPCKDLSKGRNETCNSLIPGARCDSQKQICQCQSGYVEKNSLLPERKAACRPATLGDFCKSNSTCGLIVNSTCADPGYCRCVEGFTSKNNKTCEKVKIARRLGSECSSDDKFGDAQCSDGVPNSECRRHDSGHLHCVCGPDYFQKNNALCLKLLQLGNQCEGDGQCLQKTCLRTSSSGFCACNKSRILLPGGDNFTCYERLELTNLQLKWKTEPIRSKNVSLTFSVLFSEPSAASQLLPISPPSRKYNIKISVTHQSRFKVSSSAFVSSVQSTVQDRALTNHTQDQSNVTAELNLIVPAAECWQKNENFRICIGAALDFQASDRSLLFPAGGATALPSNEICTPFNVICAPDIELSLSMEGPPNVRKLPLSDNSRRGFSIEIVLNVSNQGSHDVEELKAPRSNFNLNVYITRKVGTNVVETAIPTTNIKEGLSAIQTEPFFAGRSRKVEILAYVDVSQSNCELYEELVVYLLPGTNPSVNTKRLSVTWDLELPNCNQAARNPCDKKDCGEFGQCEAVTETEARCKCTDYYTGPNCTQEPPIDPCLSQECGFGQCERTNATSSECFCSPGYSGNTCQLALQVFLGAVQMTQLDGQPVSYKKTYATGVSEDFKELQKATCNKVRYASTLRIEHCSIFEVREIPSNTQALREFAATSHQFDYGTGVFVELKLEFVSMTGRIFDEALVKDSIYESKFDEGFVWKKDSVKAYDSCSDPRSYSCSEFSSCQTIPGGRYICECWSGYTRRQASSLAGALCTVSAESTSSDSEAWRTATTVTGASLGALFLITVLIVLVMRQRRKEALLETPLSTPSSSQFDSLGFDKENAEQEFQDIPSTSRRYEAAERPAAQQHNPVNFAPMRQDREINRRRPQSEAPQDFSRNSRQEIVARALGQSPNIDWRAARQYNVRIPT